MKFINLLIPSVLSGLILTTSCSRSLSDYGYGRGELTTVNANDIGPISLYSPHVSQSQGTAPATTNIVRTQGYGAYNTNDRAVFLVNDKESQKLTKSERRGLFFLQDFYTRLNNEFNQKKFSKKFSNTLSADISKDINKARQTDTADVRLGWQIFNGDPAVFGNRYVISYAGNSWYMVSAQAIQTGGVLVKLQPATKYKGFVISGLKNEYRNVDIGD